MSIHSSQHQLKVSENHTAIGMDKVRVGVAALLAGAASTPLMWNEMHASSTEQHIIVLSIAISVLAVSCALLMVAVPELRKGFVHWRLGPWYVAVYGATFGAASLGWLHPRLDSGSSQIRLDAVEAALQLSLVGLGVWVLGYMVGPPALLVRVANRAIALAQTGLTPTLRTGSRIWTVFAIGTLAKLLSAALTGGFGYLGDPSAGIERAAPYALLLSILSGLSTVGVAMAAYDACSLRQGSRKSLILFLAIEFFVGSVSGTKGYFVTTALAVLIAYGAQRGSLSRRGVSVGILIFLLVVIPFNASYRTAVRGDQDLTPSQGASAAPRILNESVQNDSPSKTATASLSYLAERLREIDSVAIIRQRTPSAIPFRNPTELLAAPLVGLVPRALWPGKPILSIGYDFTVEYYGLAGLYTSSAIAPQGDLFRYGGYPVAVIGMFIFGMACRLLDRCIQPERDPRAMFFLILLVPLIVRSEADIATMLTSLPSIFVAGALAIRLASCSVMAGRSAIQQ